MPKKPPARVKSVPSAKRLTPKLIARLKGEVLKQTCQEYGIRPVPKKAGDQRKGLEDYLARKEVEEAEVESSSSDSDLEENGDRSGKAGPVETLTDEEYRKLPRIPPELFPLILRGPVFDELAAAPPEEELTYQHRHESRWVYLPFTGTLRQVCKLFNRHILEVVAEAKRETYRVSWDVDGGNTQSECGGSLRKAFTLHLGELHIQNSATWLNKRITSRPVGAPQPMESILRAAHRVRRLVLYNLPNQSFWEMAARLCPAVVTVQYVPNSIDPRGAGTWVDTTPKISTALKMALRTWHEAGFGGLRNLILPKAAIDEDFVKHLSIFCPFIRELSGDIRSTGAEWDAWANSGSLDHLRSFSSDGLEGSVFGDEEYKEELNNRLLAFSRRPKPSMLRLTVGSGQNLMIRKPPISRLALKAVLSACPNLRIFHALDLTPEPGSDIYWRLGRHLSKRCPKLMQLEIQGTDNPWGFDWRSLALMSSLVKIELERPLEPQDLIHLVHVPEGVDRRISFLNRECRPEEILPFLQELEAHIALEIAGKLPSTSLPVMTGGKLRMDIRWDFDEESYSEISTLLSAIGNATASGQRQPRFITGVVDKSDWSFRHEDSELYIWTKLM
ncbi:hypothetical protein HKX48_002872 [Thoreauomyces humboldtii]|nr:hypothetical protein HKX48_002872 [Thoreauomyces humboldtii]